MTSHFDHNKRYQIVLPYKSDKIYVEPNLYAGADRCYKEIEIRKIKTPEFTIYDIDSNKLYHFEIPKYKNVDIMKLNDVINNNNDNDINNNTNNNNINNNT